MLEKPWKHIWISFNAGIILPSLLAARNYAFALYLEDKNIFTISVVYESVGHSDSFVF